MVDENKIGDIIEEEQEGAADATQYTFDLREKYGALIEISADGIDWHEAVHVPIEALYMRVLTLDGPVDLVTPVKDRS